MRLMSRANEFNKIFTKVLIFFVTCLFLYNFAAKNFGRCLSSYPLVAAAAEIAIVSLSMDAV